MKRIVCIMLALLLLCGCTKREDAPADDTAVLTDADWQGHDDVCLITVSFGEDGSFSNSCACGEPPGFSDVAESYRYDEDTHVLELIDGEDEVIHTGKVLYVDDTYLIVRLWDKVYTYENTAGYVPTVRDSVQATVGTDTITKPCLTILAFDGEVLTVSAYNYDHDAADNFTVWTLEADDDITFSSVSVTVTNGENEVVEATALDADDRADIGEYYHSGYLTLSPDGTVADVVFYGELLIWE